MKRRGSKKLTLSRETLHRLEEGRLRGVAGGTVVQPCPESVSYCITQLCITGGYTGCAACNEES